MSGVGSGTGFTCATAPGKVFETREEMLQHYKSDWHRYNLKRKVANLPPIPEATFQLMQNRAEARKKAAENSAKKQDHVKQNKREETEKRRDRKGSESAQSKPVNAQPEEMIIDEEELKKPVNVCASMFDNNEKEFPTVEENLAHMQKEYGFFVPDSEYISDVEGLLRYCTQKIRVGRLCLFCDRGFPSYQAAIQHMVDKSHCKIRWGTEEDLEEFEDFYDYSSTWNEVDGETAAEDSDKMETGEESADKKTSTMEYLDTGEILFHDSDGKSRRVGTRAFRRYYRQNYSPEDTRASVLASSKEQLLLMYKKAGVETTTELSTWKAKQKHVYTKEERKMVQKQKRAQFYQARLKLRDGLQVNLQTKNRVAKKNVGQGLGVHG